MSASSILVSMKHRRGSGSCSAEVELTGPLDIPRSVEVFRRSGDDLVDRWDGTTLLRTIRIAGESIPLACTPAGTVAKPTLTVTTDDARHQDAATAAARRFFATVTPAVLRRLTGADPVVRAAEEMYRGVRPVLQPDVLTALVRAISAQQINLRFAAVVRARLVQRYGSRHEVDGHEVWSLEPAALAHARAADLRALQFTTRKSEYIIGVAAAVDGGALDANRLAAQSDEQVIAELVTLPGIGRWTAEWLLARSFGRPVVVAGDLGVRKAVGQAYKGGAMPTEQEVRDLTAHWGDAAGVAQQLLLHVLADDRWDELRGRAIAIRNAAAGR
jgi:DNA-3-methyladenine glycosylase II